MQATTVRAREPARVPFVRAGARKGRASALASGSLALMLQAVLMLLLSVQVAFAQAPAAGQPLQLLASPSDMSLLLRVAEREGYLGAGGLKVRMGDCSSGVDCVDRLLAGEADVVTASAMPVVFAGLAGRELVVLGGIAAERNVVGLVADARSGVRQAQDLVGRRVGLVKRSSGHYVLDMLALSHGFEPERVRRVGMRADQVADAFGRGEIDAALIWSPHLDRAVATLGEHALQLPLPALYTATYNLVTTREVLAQRGGAIRELLRAVARAERWVADRPAQARAMLARPGRSEASLARVWDNLRPAVSIEPSLALQMRSIGRWAVREGHAPQRPWFDPAQMIEPGPLRDVVPKAVAWP